MNVDWDLAARVAHSVLGDEPAGVPPVDLADLGEDARVRVLSLTGLPVEGDLPPLEWVDRRTWVDANLVTMRSTLAPVLDRAPDGPAPLAAVGATVVAAEIGALLGMFGRRVLGQYEVSLLDPDQPPRLMLVGPNVAGAAAEMDADPGALTTWIGLHEMTHAVQFAAAPWLREHLGGMLRELLESADVKIDPRALLRVDLSDLRALVEAVRDGGLLGAVAGPRRRGLLESVQATMSLVEGHAEHVMDEAAEGAVDDMAGLRAALDRRRAERAPLLRILDRLLGMDMKLRQYETGRRFCDAVVDRRGEAGLRVAFASPDGLPRLSELDDAETWLARTAA